MSQLPRRRRGPERLTDDDAHPRCGNWTARALSNVEIYQAIFAIETILRELVIDAMQSAFGAFWYRDKLPQEALEHFRVGVERDRLTKWTSNLPHHPVYYLTFPDLRATIEAKGNWSAVFSAIFPKNKDLLTTDLVELDFIRNKVAHNRRATPDDVAIAVTAYEKLCNQLGPRLVVTLGRRYTVADRIPAGLIALRREADVCIALSAGGARPKAMAQWRHASSTWWWFDEHYLGYSLKRVTKLFAMLVDYCEAWGQLSDSEKRAWSDEHDLRAIYTDARLDLNAILESWHRD